MREVLACAVVGLQHATTLTNKIYVLNLYYKITFLFMRTTISIAFTSREAERTKKLAKKRGFPTVSGYFRFLLAQDDVDLISEAELIRRSAEADRLHQKGKLIAAKSMSELLE